MTNSNIISVLRARRQQENEGAVSAYWDFARAIFEGKPVDADALDACLRETGRSPEELSEHVKLFREIANAEADAEVLGDIDELIRAEQDADRELRSTLAECDRIRNLELPRREEAAQAAARAAEAATKRARKAQAAVTAAYARLRAAQGEVQPEPVEPEEPKLVVTQRRIPSNRPRNLDPSLWDHVVLASGKLVWRNKNTGEVVE